MSSNKNYAKVAADCTAAFAPIPLQWEKTFVSSWTDEETGETFEDHRTERRSILNPTPEEMADMGYLPVAEPVQPDPPDEGMHWELSPSLWDTDGSVCRRRWVMVENPPEVPVVRAWTPLTVMRELKSKGLWDAVLAKMAQDDLYEFLACRYVKEDDPMFVPILAMARASFGDAAVDAMLDEMPTEVIG